MHHLGVNSFFNLMKKIFIFIIIGLMWCSNSFAEIYLFKAQYINKLKDIELDYNYCIKTKNKVACNRDIQEHQKIKSDTKFKKFLSSNKCDAKCKKIIDRLAGKEFLARMAASDTDLNKILKSLPKN